MAAQNGDEAIVELLLAKEADVNVKDRYGRTPLDLAGLKAKQAVADLLRSRGGKTGKALKAEAKK